MRTMTIFVFLAFGVAGAAAKDCSALQTQQDLNICEGKNLEEADARLNEIYAKLTAKTDANAKPKLVEAQRAWIKFRDAQCDYETLDSVGGSIHPMDVAICHTELTKARTKTLERQISCPNRDSVCPDR